MRSKRATAVLSVLLASILACNMPLPGPQSGTGSNAAGGTAAPDMALDEAVNTTPDDRRNEVLSLMGAPDVFSIHRQPVDGKDVRWEEWSYFDAGARFDFVDGELVWTAGLDPAPDGSLFCAPV